MGEDARYVALEARVKTLELAVTALSRRIPPPDQPATQTVFNIPVVLAPGVTADDVRAAADALPSGLSSRQAVESLEGSGLLRMVQPA